MRRYDEGLLDKLYTYVVGYEREGARLRHIVPYNGNAEIIFVYCKNQRIFASIKKPREDRNDAPGQHSGR